MLLPLFAPAHADPQGRRSSKLRRQAPLYPASSTQLGCQSCIDPARVPSPADDPRCRFPSPPAGTQAARQA
eukprot:scaffold1187_cov258-Pinguiococcus_pyrenoidosus.AAC.15